MKSIYIAMIASTLAVGIVDSAAAGDEALCISIFWMAPEAFSYYSWNVLTLTDSPRV